MANDWYKLTKKQQIVYDLYYNQNNTQKDIADRLQITQPAVAKLLKKIRIKIGVTKKRTGGYISRGMVKPNHKKYWRIHGLHFIVKPYYFYPRYKRTIDKIGNYGIPFKNYTLMLYDECIRVMLREGESYDHVDKYKAIQLAETDFSRVLKLAGNKYGFEVFKEGKANIRLVNSHIALNPSDLGEKEEHILIRGYDNKVYFMTDASKGEEYEYIGKQSFSVSEKIEPYFNDLRYNQPMTNSELQARLTDMVMLLEKVVKRIN